MNPPVDGPGTKKPVPWLRTELSPPDAMKLQIWYLSGAFLIFLILIIGGITRLTESGLSIVEWKPVTGLFPPFTEQQWQQEFDLYRQFPEYQQKNRGMSLAEFQWIYFWEYLHRMAGRFLGLAFLVPFGWFLLSRRLDRVQFRRALILLGLGMLQGFMGWFMVKSGLVDLPYVSPYRLAVHLLLAFILYGLCFRFALDAGILYGSGSGDGQEGPTGIPGGGDTSGNGTADKRKEVPGVAHPGIGGLKRWTELFLLVLLLQVVWGAFVAGSNAGLVYNTFPKMYQSWIAPELHSGLSALFVTQGGMQWMHRLLGTLLGILALAVYFKGRRIEPVQSTALLAITLLQYGIGIYTLLNYVPIVAGVAHQAVALILFGVSIRFHHHLSTVGQRSPQVS